MNSRVKEVRQALGLSMETFGARIGVTRSAISRIESGVVNVTNQNTTAICREFNVNEEWLRYGTGEMFNIPEGEIAALISSILDNPDDYQFFIDLAKIYVGLSPELRKVLSDFIQNLSQNLPRNTLK